MVKKAHPRIADSLPFKEEQGVKGMSLESITIRVLAWLTLVVGVVIAIGTIVTLKTPGAFLAVSYLAGTIVAWAVLLLFAGMGDDLRWIRNHLASGTVVSSIQETSGETAYIEKTDQGYRCSACGGKIEPIMLWGKWAFPTTCPSCGRKLSLESKEA